MTQMTVSKVNNIEREYREEFNSKLAKWVGFPLYKCSIEIGGRHEGTISLSRESSLYLESVIQNQCHNELLRSLNISERELLVPIAD
jgi:hypothetical protein